MAMLTISLACFATDFCSGSADFTKTFDMATQSPYTNTTENITAVTSTVHLKPDTTVIAVVATLIVLTVILLSVLLYHYMCHNKGDYRTTGELAPGEDLDEDSGNQAAGEKKEYFI